MTVAVHQNGQWHRAEILYLLGNDAFIMLVDSGSRVYVKVKQLHYLEKSFALPSRKCCKGSLFGVKPKNDEDLWSSQAMVQFQSKTKGKKLSAIVKAEHDEVYELLLLIDNVSKRSKLSDFMIEQGFADVLIVDSSINAILVSFNLRDI